MGSAAWRPGWSAKHAKCRISISIFLGFKSFHYRPCRLVSVKPFDFFHASILSDKRFLSMLLPCPFLVLRGGFCLRLKDSSSDFDAGPSRVVETVSCGTEVYRVSSLYTDILSNIRSEDLRNTPYDNADEQLQRISPIHQPRVLYGFTPHRMKNLGNIA